MNKSYVAKGLYKIIQKLLEISNAKRIRRKSKLYLQ